MSPLAHNQQLMIVSGINVQRHVTPMLMSFLRDERARGTAIGAICSGAYVLAKAGFLNERRAAVHWEYHDLFAERFPNVKLTKSVFVADEKFVTASGGAAVADLMLHIIGRDHGRELAAAVADQMVYNSVRDGTANQKISMRSRYGVRNPRFSQAVKIIEDHIEAPLRSTEVARRVGITSRQMERLFVRYMNTTPRRYIMDVRLHRARNLVIRPTMHLPTSQWRAALRLHQHSQEPIVSNTGAARISADTKLTPRVGTMNMSTLRGKIALVTGAAGGIGGAIVKQLRAAGVLVAVADRDVGSVNAEYHLPGNLLDQTYTDALPQAVFDELGGLDIVINNAGVITRGSVTATSDEDWKLSLGVNVEAPFRICRAAIPIMASNGGGAIVNVASCWGVRPGPNHAVYCMTKAAIASLTQCMGMDHAHQKIRINAVCPNEVNTPMLRSGFAKRGFDPNSAVAELGKSVPLGSHCGARRHRRSCRLPGLGCRAIHVRIARRGQRRKARGMSRFAGKVALVTGGRSGIGLAISRRLRDDGARVFTAQRGEDREFEAVAVDIGNSDAANGAVNAVVSKAGRLDILINNAGVMQEAFVEEMSIEDWQRTISINLTAPFLLIKPALPHLRASKGVIVNVGSIEGLSSNPKHAPTAPRRPASML